LADVYGKMPESIYTDVGAQSTSLMLLAL